MDNFVAIAWLNGCIGPLRAREDLKVTFDGDAACGEIQVAQQVGNCGARRGFATLSIDSDCVRRFHLFNSTLRSLFVAKSVLRPGG